MPLFDTHAHLHFDQFQNDLEEVLNRSRESGIRHIVTIGTDLDTSRQVIDLCDRYPELLLGAVGIHPTDCAGTTERDVRSLRDLVQHHSHLVAIGEIGLDLYWKTVPLQKQWEVFLWQKNLAEDLDLPMIIHTRDAYQEMVTFFGEHPPNRPIPGVMHAFDGEKEHARIFLDMGFYISFTGVVTFKNYRKKELVQYIPADRLLIETDSPFLTPHPHRGKRNEPSYLSYTLQAIASIRGENEQKLMEILWENSLKFFNIK